MANEICDAERESDEFGDPAAGFLVAAKYRVEALIARGGMATIFRAEHVGLGERVAIKLLLPRFRESPEFVARFRREARASARLRSEHVARVLDFGELDDGSPYLAMDLLDGQDLEARLLEHGPFATPEAVDMILQACEALAEAHALGIIHRDLKPQNLFLTSAADGSSVLKIIDFGIAKTLGASAVVTGKHTSMGTPHYMSPEQLHASDSVDARSDIWSVGVIIHELLTCKNVFDAPTPREVLMLVSGSEPVLRLEAHHPAGLRSVIERCLSTNREARYASVREFAEAIAPFGSPSAKERVAKLRRVEDAAKTRGVTLSGLDAPSSVRRPLVSALVSTSDATLAQSQVTPRPYPWRRIVGGASALAIAALVFAFTPRDGDRRVGAPHRGSRVDAPMLAIEERAASLATPDFAASPTRAPPTEAVREPVMENTAPRASAVAPASSASGHRGSGPRDRWFKSRK